VDGCYSFWQGGAVAVLDGWLLEKYAADDKQTLHEDVHELTFDQMLLQRYILLCAQDVNGGLRDKPSKQRDFYHSCYNLSGLSVAQHRLPGTWPDRDHSSVKRTDELNDLFGDTSYNVIGRTDPVINIRVERVRFMLDQKLSDNTSF
jgi:protein farnesyltransferase subunit beta